MSKVLPYKKILPKELHRNILRGFLDNDSKLNRKPEPRITKEVREDTRATKETEKDHLKSKSIDSKIVTLQHAELISKWIDRLGTTDKRKNPYKFRLMLRG